jgi:CBS domain containing-hemolysin-like protein
MWVLSLLLGIIVICAITAATGYFVAQEFAFMAVDRSRLAARAAAGDTAAKRALDVTRRTSFMLSGAQLGITVTALLVGYVAEPLVGEALGTALGGIGVPTGVGIAVGTVLALVFSTIVQMIFGELFPKNLAIARPDTLALRLARSTATYLALFGWLIRIFDAASNALLRILRIEPVHDVEHSATARDLQQIVSQSRDSGDLPPDLSMLLDRVLDFPEQDVEHAMIPRALVDVVECDDSITHVRELMAAGHSRYPVVNDDDEVIGLIHMTDVLAQHDAPTGNAQAMARPALFIPNTMALPDALRELTRSDRQLACVVDEYGGFAGILTIEDIAEELVGEITDEHDNPAASWTALQVAEGTWVMAGGMHLDEVERTIGRELPEGEYETLAGLAIYEFGALPQLDTSITVQLPRTVADLTAHEESQPDELVLTVLAINRHVPARLRVDLVIHLPEGGDE